VQYLKYWWIIQSIDAYDQHPDLIGCGFKEGTEKLVHKKFESIKKGDHIVYYATGDKVLLGIFEVTSEMHTLKDDAQWGHVAVYDIRPAVMPTEGFLVDWRKVLFDPAVSLELFPDRNRWTYKIWDRYIHPAIFRRL